MRRRERALGVTVAAAVLTLNLGCRHEPTPASTTTLREATALPARSTDGPRAIPPRTDSTTPTPPAEADPLAVPDGPIARAKSIGHTSVVLRLDFASGGRAAFKPASKRGPRRYKGEVAASRLAELLELPNVPPARIVRLPTAAVARALRADPRGSALWAREAIGSKDDPQRVSGALIPWIDGLRFAPLEAEPWSSRVRGWLRHDAVIPDERPFELPAAELAAQTSTLVAFDLLTANWDRWSGGNIGLDPGRHRLVYLDNDGAFFDPPPAAGLARTRRILAGIDRFSRRFVTRLRAVTDDDLRAALGDEAPGLPLLAPRVVAGLCARRADLVRAIDAKIAAHGEAATLAFP